MQSHSNLLLSRAATLLAAGLILLSVSAAALAISAEPARRAQPVWEAITDAEAVSPAPSVAGAEAFSLPAPVFRFLLRLPGRGGEATLIDGAGQARHFSSDGTSVVLSAPAGDYTLSCAGQSASLRLSEDGTPQVLDGSVVWDGEQLLLGGLGTLELSCLVFPAAQRTLTIECAGETCTRTAAYDPLLDQGQGCVVTFTLALPLGSVTVSTGGASQTVTLRDSEPVRLVF